VVGLIKALRTLGHANTIGGITILVYSTLGIYLFAHTRAVDQNARHDPRLG
jgi:hypothetical protein